MHNDHSLHGLLNQAAQATANHHFAEAIGYYDQIVAQTDATTKHEAEKTARQMAWRERGRLLDLLSERVASLASYQQYRLEATTSTQVVDALILIGNQYQYIGDYKNAFESFNEAHHLAKLENYVTGRAQAYCGMGIIQVSWGKLPEGIKALQIALSLFEQTQNQIEQIRTSNRLGVAHIKTGQIDKAIQFFSHSRSLVSEQTNQDPIALTAGLNALNNLGECYQLLYELEKATLCHRQGLEFAQARELWSQATDLYRNLGVDLILAGQISEGLPYLLRALELSEETNQLDMKLQSLYSLAWAEIQLGHLEQGFEYGSRLIHLTQESNLIFYQASAFFVMGLYYQHSNQRDKAKELWQQGIFLAHQTDQLMLLWQIHAAFSLITENEALKESHRALAAEIILQIVYPIEDEVLRQTFLRSPAILKILTKG